MKDLSERGLETIFENYLYKHFDIKQNYILKKYKITKYIPDYYIPKYDVIIELKNYNKPLNINSKEYIKYQNKLYNYCNSHKTNRAIITNFYYFDFYYKCKLLSRVQRENICLKSIDEIYETLLFLYPEYK